MLAKCDDLTIDIDFGNTIRKSQCGFETVCQASLYASLAHEAIDHNLDRVVLIAPKLLIGFEKFSNLHHFAVDAST